MINGIHLSLFTITQGYKYTISYPSLEIALFGYFPKIK